MTEDQMHSDTEGPARLDFAEGLRRARGHLTFLAAILTAGALIIGVEVMASGAQGSGDPSVALLTSADQLPLAPQAQLSPHQMAWGRLAWLYFQNNTDPDTGLANAADKYPSTTMWDTGSFLMGMIAAERIGVISRQDFDVRMGRALASLSRLPLFDGALPNKAYNTHTLRMVDYNNNPTSRGLGWSALDIARLYVPLGILARDYPEHSASVRAVVDRWDTSRLAHDGLVFGSAVTNGATSTHQEGRVGYEEYAAKSLIRAGLDAYQAWRTDSKVKLVKVDGVLVPVDTRKAGDWGAQVYATSEPYILDGLEFGFDTRSRAFSAQIFRAEQERFERTGVLTAVSEGHIDRAPSFVYATVQANGRDWAVITDTGKRYDSLRTLSTKTAFALDALYGAPYTERLLNAAVTFKDPTSGWLEGRYETGGRLNAILTANTNGVILESLAYRAQGPLVKAMGG
jgi:hypothetical protein